MTPHSAPSPDVDDLAPEQLVVAALFRINQGWSAEQALATVRAQRLKAYASGAAILPLLQRRYPEWADVAAKWAALG